MRWPITLVSAPFPAGPAARPRARIPAVHRRDFLLGSALGMAGMLTGRAWADHHTVSASPLMVEFDLASATSRYTSAADFFVRDHADEPSLFGASSGLHLIDNGVHRWLSLDALHRLPLRTFSATLECAGNGVGTGGVSNGLWQGWAMADLFKASGMSATSPWIHVRGRDGYARSMPAQQGWNDGFVVMALNQQALPARHGAPLRALLRGWYGMNSVKWLDSIEFADRPLPGNDSGYTELIRHPDGMIEKRPLPRMQVKSVIIAPAAGSVLHRGEVELRGLAWSGTGAIASVEVRADQDESWTSAEISRWERHEWVFWRWRTRVAARGPITFTCRARDTHGSVQPQMRAANRLDGYANNGWHVMHYVVI